LRSEITEIWTRRLKTVSDRADAREQEQGTMTIRSSDVFNDLRSPAQAPSSRSQLTFLATSDLNPDPRNPRRHSRAQIRAIATSIETFGFTAPILINKNNQIIAGHGRYEAAKLLGLTQVPVICLEHLTEAQVTAYMLADNKLTDRSSWDDTTLAVHLKELSNLVLEFDIEATGFEPPEIDFRIQSLDATESADTADEFNAAVGPAISLAGDLWLLDSHRLYCGSALDATAYDMVLGTGKAAAVFTDSPYNVRIDGHVCGSGRIKHREFAMASGEMTEDEFIRFLTKPLELACSYASGGAIIYAFMDWRHMGEMLAAGHATGCSLLSLCIWVKANAGMGSFYRSRHELVFVFRNGKEAHLNNVQLGRFGRNRTNVWNYAGVNSFARKGQERALNLHPTVKPIALVSDAILDSTKRDHIVLDPFLGSGTTILAAERTGRRCYGIEIDPLYVDTAIERWESITKHQARHSSGKTFAAIKAERRITL
jgi:DNA modification methylase